MELICPSCEARYQLPEGSISAKGRQVSCMNCGNSWHAYPPMQLGDPSVGGAAAAPSDPKGIRYEPPAGAPRPGERRVQEPSRAEMGGPSPMSPVTAPAADGPFEAAGGGQARAEASRSEQMAEIRQMLAEVQSDERADAANRPEAERTRIIPAAGAARLSPAEEEAERARQRLAQERADAEQAAREAEAMRDEYVDEGDLRRRIDRHQDREQPKPTDVKKIRRRHDRRVNQKKHASKAGSGAFLTGFLLVAVIAATMVSLYVLTPQIVARVPEAERPMQEYRATMDRLRVGASESIAGLQEWIAEKFGDKES